MKTNQSVTLITHVIKETYQTITDPFIYLGILFYFMLTFTVESITQVFLLSLSPHKPLPTLIWVLLDFSLRGTHRGIMMLSHEFIFIFCPLLLALLSLQGPSTIYQHLILWTLLSQFFMLHPPELLKSSSATEKSILGLICDLKCFSQSEISVFTHYYSGFILQVPRAN